MYIQRQKITNIKRNDLTAIEKEFVSAFSQGRGKRVKEMLKSGEPLLRAIEYALDNLEYGNWARSRRVYAIINYPNLSVYFKYLFLEDVFINERISHTRFMEIMNIFIKDSRFDLSFYNNFLLMSAVSNDANYHSYSISYLMNDKMVQKKILELEQFEFLKFLPNEIKNKEFYDEVMEKYPHKLV